MCSLHDQLRTRTALTSTDSCQEGQLRSTIWPPVRIVGARCSWLPAARRSSPLPSGTRPSTGFGIPSAQPTAAIAVMSCRVVCTILAATWSHAQVVAVSSSRAPAKIAAAGWRRAYQGTRSTSRRIRQLWLAASLSQGSATPSGPTRTANWSEPRRRRAAIAVAASPAAHQVGLCGRSPARSAAASKISR